MNQTTATLSPEADAFARRVALRLTQASDELHHDISERLRVARLQALAERKRPATQPALHWRSAPAVLAQGPAATLGGGAPSHWWQPALSVVWIVALLIGLVLVHHTQVENTTSELTEIDTALLTDELPPSAYADPGFAQFLKSSRSKP
ncbi:DUF3619 family protein [Comamonas sp. NLF-1-9]|uniref:DUF3619 family protein n=1 Tax=Comamonas sp. NLF-1-9 TaxID=2853163 RepID=UPI001C4503FE|nr:DUF3619 family protein [Comamonas sp. NLF-1-9]QXL84782.1 DUF3619 family protein [Comamonas sp. NLF-1-9]